MIIASFTIWFASQVLASRYSDRPRDNDRRRDLTPRGIVTAISHLIAAHVPIENDFIILNHWR
jgi:hypothetical protein